MFYCVLAPALVCVHSCASGQHYDPMVFAPEGAATPVEQEVRQFPVGDTANDEGALQCAQRELKEKNERAAQRVVKKLKCTGCGAILDDNDAFQAHCGEVEHDDDFAYMCDEIEIIESGDTTPPEDRVDLTSDDVFTFYNTEASAFATVHMRPLEIGGMVYPSVSSVGHVRVVDEVDLHKTHAVARWCGGGKPFVMRGW